MDKEQILIKHLKTMLKRTKQSYVTVEQMKETPEYKAVLNAMDEMEDELVKNNAVLHGVSARTLGIGSAASVIKAMSLDQAIQLIKSDITGLPQTQVIDGELIVAYVR